MTLVTTSAWWQRAISGVREPIKDGHPCEGYYATRGSKGGALLPARIWRQGAHFFCTVAGRESDAVKEWPFLARRPISAETYERMVALLKQHGGPKEARRAKLHELSPPRWK